VAAVGSGITPLAVEETVRATTPAGVPLMGIVDLRCVEGETEMLTDYKFSAKKWTLGRFVNTLQFHIYVYMTGLPSVSVHNMTLPKTSKGTKRRPAKTSEECPGVRFVSDTLNIFTKEFTDLNIDHTLDIVESSVRLITSGCFMPCDPGAWCCTPDWCGYWGLCRGKPTANLRDKLPKHKEDADVTI
jgi:hypothetical protein